MEALNRVSDYLALGVVRPILAEIGAVYLVSLDGREVRVADSTFKDRVDGAILCPATLGRAVDLIETLLDEVLVAEETGCVAVLTLLCEFALPESSVRGIISTTTRTELPPLRRRGERLAAICAGNDSHHATFFACLRHISLFAFERHLRQ